MKNSLIIALAAVALFASCVKEAPVNEENSETPVVKETVVFSVGFEQQTKTAFGALADGKYPNLWCAGDKISVNGVESTEVEDAAVGTSSATFTVEDVAAPYCVAYPVAAFSNYADGAANVAIPAEQAWTEGTYDPAAMIMIAKTSETTFTFSPLVSVIRITPETSVADIKSIKVKSLGSQKLSGTFTTDFESIAAADGASDEVTMVAAEAVAAGKEWFIAIPAGDYQASGFQVTITDADGNVINKTVTPTKAYVGGHVYTLSLNAVPAVITIKGHDAIVAFGGTSLHKVDYETLIIDGNNETVTNSEMSNLRFAIGKVSKDLTFKNIKGWSMPEQVVNWSGTAGTFSELSAIPEGSIRFINCPDLDNFGGLRAFTRIDGDLEIDGAKPYWGWGSFANITEITGNVIIKNIRSKADGGSSMNTAFFSGLKKVGGDFHFENCNSCDFWQFCNIDVEEIAGTLKVINCTGFSNFGAGTGSTHTGVMALTKLGGVYVKGTGAIAALGSGTANGFDLIQKYINEGIVDISNVECYDNAGKLVIFKDPNAASEYPENATVVNGKSAILAIHDHTAKVDYEYLVLDGEGESISDSEMSTIKTGIGACGTIVFKNIKGWSMIEQVISANETNVHPTGSMYFINCPDLSNINGLKWITKVNGDLVFEDCPKAIWNWGAGNCCNCITEITGNFTINNSATALTGATCLASLQKVGGNLTITNNNTGFWDLNGMPLTEIGGNFTYTDNSLVNSFLGFAGLTKIGGDLLVKGTAITDFSQVQSWITNGVLKGTAECWNGSTQVVFE